MLAWACLASCQRQPTRAQPPTASSATPAPAPPAPAPEAAATEAPTAEVLSAEVRLPARMAPGQKVPLLLILHSLGTSAEDVAAKTDWPSVADQQGIAWLAPNGPIDAQGRRFWDAGPECCNFDGPPLDHVAALRKLLERVLVGAPIDRERVFVGGTSNGGFMAHRLACAAPDLVAGIVSIAGAGPSENPTCMPAQSLRVLQIHGDADPIVTYGGGHLFQDPKLPRHPSAEQTVGAWAVRLGCSDRPIEAPPLDLEAHRPGIDTRVTRYEGCSRGQVELWTVTGGGHYLAYRSPAPEIIWRFLNR